MLRTHPFIRFLNQNRRKIRNIILVIVFIFLLVRILDNIAEKNYKQEIAEKNKYENELIIIEKQKEIITEFLDYCVNKDENRAYELISTECKKSKYNSISEFNNDYIEKYFSENKIYNIKFNSNDDGEYNYYIRILTDMLSSGKVDENVIEQNFSVIIENNSYKIQINI